VPYSKNAQAAVLQATNAQGLTRQFDGTPDDNSAYGSSALAETVAMRAARTAGFDRDVTLAVTVDDVKARNPIDGNSLQVLREFGDKAKVLLVGRDGSVVHSDINELLPESFGPESLV
jgi:cytidine deaminase